MIFPESVCKILNTLKDSGFEAYAVGGCVRDNIMGRVPKDYDVATSALPEDVIRLFPRVICTGKKYGTVTVLYEMPVEVTTFRVDGDYIDGRHPERVCFSSHIEEDLSRRDLTINAMACDGVSECVDPFGGQADIKAKLVRCVGDPIRRFSEDALRIFRVFRFASELDFDIEPATLNACIKLAGLMRAVSIERITVELCKTLMGKNPDILLPLLNSGGLEQFGFHKPLNDFNISKLPCVLSCRLAALIFLCSYGKKDEIQILNGLRLSNADRSMTEGILSGLHGEIVKNAYEIKILFHTIPPESFCDFLLTYGVIHNISVEEAIAMTKQVISNCEPWKLSMLAIDGRQLMKLGIPAGKAIGDALGFLLDYVLEYPDANNEKDLVLILKKYMIGN